MCDSKKCKFIFSNRKQISGYMGEGWKRRSAQGQDGSVHYLDLMMYRYVKTYQIIHLKYVHLWYINYSSIKLSWKQLSSTMSVLCPEPSICPRVKGTVLTMPAGPSLARSLCGLCNCSLPRSFSSTHTEFVFFTCLFKDIRHVSTSGTSNELFPLCETFVTQVSMWPGPSFKPLLKCHICNETPSDHVT